MQTLMTLRPMERRIFYLLFLSAAALIAVLAGRLLAGPVESAAIVERTARTALAPTLDETCLLYTSRCV